METKTIKKFSADEITKILESRTGIFYNKRKEIIGFWGYLNYEDES